MMRASSTVCLCSHTEERSRQTSGDFYFTCRSLLPSMSQPFRGPFCLEIGTFTEQPYWAQQISSSGDTLQPRSDYHLYRHVETQLTVARATWTMVHHVLHESQTCKESRQQGCV